MVRGRLFRSAAPPTPTPADRLLAHPLLAHRITHVVDLRGGAERSGAGALAAEGVTVIHAPVETRSSPSLLEAIAAPSATPESVRATMIEVYRGFAGPAAGQFGAALSAIAAAPGPVLVHCTAGKDRTGFLVAVLQRALGVHEDDVHADFLATNAQWDRASVGGRFTADAALVEPVLTADLAYLDAAFDAIRRHDGSVDAFIARASGDPALVSRLTRFIEQE
jgi:protein-tyrosine phosphatase